MPPVRRSCLIATLWLLCSYFFLLFAPPSSFAQYAITSLGRFTPTAINNSGEVVGYQEADSLTSRAVLYRSGTLRDLGGLRGSNWCGATAINNNGTVVGYCTVFSQRVGFVYTTSMSEIRTPDGYDSVAYGINDHEQVVGELTSHHHYWRSAFIYQSGVLRDLHGLLGNSNAVAINNSNQMIGEMFRAGGPGESPYLLSSGVFTFLDTAGASGYTRAVNDSGQVAGSYLGRVVHEGRSVSFWVGAVWSGGVRTDLMPPAFNVSSTAQDINNHGQVVGHLSTPGESGPIIYEGGRVRFLNRMIGAGAGWYLTEVRGINDVGQITGSGNNGAFLMTPITTLIAMSTDLSSLIESGKFPPPLGPLLLNNAEMLGAALKEERIEESCDKAATLIKEVETAVTRQALTTAQSEKILVPARKIEEWMGCRPGK